MDIISLTAKVLVQGLCWFFAVSFLLSFLIIFPVLIPFFLLMVSAYLYSNHLKKKKQSIVNSQVIELKGDGGYSQEVVGEYYNQDNLITVLSRISTKKYKSEGVYPTKVKIILENDNPHDSKAIAIIIDGLVVGHLSKLDARIFRNNYGENTAFYYVCPAIITERDGSRNCAGILLDLDIHENYKDKQKLTN